MTERQRGTGVRTRRSTPGRSTAAPVAALLRRAATPPPAPYPRVTTAPVPLESRMRSNPARGLASGGIVQAVQR